MTARINEVLLRPVPRLDSRSPEDKSMPTPSKKREKFYHSKAWAKVKETKRLMARGICERCGKAGWEVHHKIPLTDENVDDPMIALNLDNLELLCTACHNAARDEEAKKQGRRRDYYFNEQGDLIFKTGGGGSKS